MQAAQYSPIIRLPTVLFYFILIFYFEISIIPNHRYNRPTIEKGDLPINATYNKSLIKATYFNFSRRYRTNSNQGPPLKRLIMYTDAIHEYDSVR